VTIPAPIASSAENGIFGGQNGAKSQRAAERRPIPYALAQPITDPAERYQLQRVVRSNVIWRSPMDDYDGRLNFLASVGVALLLFVVVIGFSGHDNGHMDALKTAAVVAPVAVEVK
jgi:hypothetical protein